MNVLFVCTANGGRSVIAERLLRRAAAGRHEARSAGSNPGTSAHPRVVEALREIGVDASDHVPRRLDDEAIAWADVVVATCDDACPLVPGKRYVSWRLPDPKHEPLERVRAIRDDIDRRVHELLSELDRPPRPTEMAHDRSRRELPTLGKRGGGWVVAQVVLLAAVTLSALVGLGWPARLEPVAYAVGALLLACGTGLLVAGGAGLGAALTPFPAPRSGGELQTAGVYRLVRHPMYGGGILLGLGWSTLFASVPGLVLTVVLAVFADAKARREELWLEQRFPDYASYRQRTARKLIPYVW